MLTLITLFLSSALAAVDINSATAKELEAFNGVGPATAAKIIDFRTTNGSFESCDQLVKVSGIGVKTLEKIKPDCVAEQPAEEGKTKASKVLKGKKDKPGPVAGKKEIPGVSEAPKKDPSNAVDINTASATELEKLTGVGASTAAAIIDYREKIGGFETCADLVKVKGIGPEKLKKLAAECTASPQ
jgi:competence protein ComEA